MHTSTSTPVRGEFVTLLGETYYRIQHYDEMTPFFMTLVSPSDHWLFVATTGGITAGRINADHALFPYYTVDRLTENADNTGSKTVIQLHQSEKAHTWIPFSDKYSSTYQLTRTLYKNISGTSLVFEEANADLGLIFRYAWRTSERFGIIKTGWLMNTTPDAVTVNITDGIQNVLPSFVSAGTQNEFSVLLDAYKRSELDSETGLGVFSLSSRLTDLAEPSEALSATTVWQVGLNATAYLLSSTQLERVRLGRSIHTETDVRGQRGAYFVHAQHILNPEGEHSWHIVAEVNQDAVRVANLNQVLRTASAGLYETVLQDITDSTAQLKRIVNGADGGQVSADLLSTGHHFANVLFNVMRGGTFTDQYAIQKTDFLAFVRVHSPNVLVSHKAFFDSLPIQVTVQALKRAADVEQDADLIRLCYGYLPLTFSRRHGDPSRPWNRFSIHVKDSAGLPQRNYEGNWRDIFQNWEALAYSYPEFIEGMLCVFLNATTLDGYNPYRIMRHGIDWEVPEPSNPWANIGYWSDHQIIYLQKLMEVCEQFYPSSLEVLLNRPIFAYANVPYRIKSYPEIVQDPYNTIRFDWDLERTIEARVRERGAEGKLVLEATGRVHYATLTEKLLNLLLAKLVNFVPEGGIWMNTQRPEWNDANNALVGKGLSVVTTSYLRRFVQFFAKLLSKVDGDFTVSQSLYTLFGAVEAILSGYHAVQDAINDVTRRAVMDALGQAGSDYRDMCYGEGVVHSTATISAPQIKAFLALVQSVLDHTILCNQREDGLFHAYNTLFLGDGVAQVHHLYLMLEGQVAVLSSGVLTPEATATLIHQLRTSDLYRADQHSYMLYPDRDLDGFFKKNRLSAEQVSPLKLVSALLERHDSRLIGRDNEGVYHFGSGLRNSRDVRMLLEEFARSPQLAGYVVAESDVILQLFEQTFEHHRFTGRSGSFFAYEGLGSIYWHMVSKLLLAVQEAVYEALKQNSPAMPSLVDAYYDIRAGLGFNKTPDVYGAFPLDPYSHTPRGQGAKQPGMTGMVKEEILTRLGELGITIQSGELVFTPTLLRQEEFLHGASTLTYCDCDNQEQVLNVPEGAFAFTFCRVPIIVRRSHQLRWLIEFHDGRVQEHLGERLDAALCQPIFAHNGFIRLLILEVNTH